MQNKEILKQIVKTEFNRPPISEGRKNRATRIEWTGTDGLLHVRIISGDGKGRIKTIKDNSLRLTKAERRDYNPETGKLASGVKETYDSITGQRISRKVISLS